MTTLRKIVTIDDIQYQLYLSIDSERIFKDLGKKAIASKGGKAIDAKGAIVVRVASQAKKS